MADQIVSWGGFNSKGTSGMGVTGSFQVSSSANSFFVGGGSVGVGTTSPSYPLDVSGNTRFQGTGLFTSGANNQISIIANTDGSTPYINFQNSGANTSRLNAVTSVSGQLINSTGMSITTTSTSSFLSLKANDIVAASNIESSGGRYYLSSATGNNGILFLHPGVSYRGLIGFDASSTYFQIRTGYTTDFSAGNLNAAFFDSGNSAFGSSTDMSARLGVKGSGTTSSTTSLLVQNSTPTNILQLKDNGDTVFYGDSITWGQGFGYMLRQFGSITYGSNHNTVYIRASVSWNLGNNVGSIGDSNGTIDYSSTYTANVQQTNILRCSNMQSGVGEGRFVLQAHGNAGGYNALGNMYIAGGRNTNGGAHGNVYLGVDLTSPLGNVSVGTTSSLNYKFNVSGSGNFTNNLTVTGSVLNQPLTLPTASGTASMDCSQSNFFNLTLSGSYTLFLSASNIQPGQTVNLRITQPATSGSLNYGSQFKFAGGIPYSASATGSAVDIISFISFDTTTLYGSAIKNLS